MAYYTDLFSPETYEAFSRSSRDISGFRQNQHAMAKRVEVGDRFVCYMTKLSRWVGILEVQTPCFIDNTPIFYPDDDPFVVRFRVKPITWLPKEKAPPIQGGNVWEFTEAVIYDSFHAVRGGSCDDFGIFMHAAYRDMAVSPATNGAYFGFRVAYIPEPATLLLLAAGGLLLARRSRISSL